MTITPRPPPPNTLPEIRDWLANDLMAWVGQVTTSVNEVVHHEIHEANIYEAGRNVNMHTLTERLREAHNEFKTGHEA